MPKMQAGDWIIEARVFLFFGFWACRVFDAHCLDFERQAAPPREMRTLADRRVGLSGAHALSRNTGTWVSRERTPSRSPERRRVQRGASKDCGLSRRCFQSPSKKISGSIGRE